MNHITEKGRKTMDKIYDTIVEYTTTHLYPPSMIEIKELVDIKSSSTIQTSLTRLEQEGKVELGNGNRCIKLIGYKLVPTDEE